MISQEFHQCLRKCAARLRKEKRDKEDKEATKKKKKEGVLYEEKGLVNEDSVLAKGKLVDDIKLADEGEEYGSYGKDFEENEKKWQ